MSDPFSEIKQLYFRATRATIERDFDRAIDLLKSLPSEDERERVTVFMQGLAEMKKQWAPGRAASEERSGEPAVRRGKTDVGTARSKRPKPGRTR